MRKLITPGLLLLALTASPLALAQAPQATPPSAANTGKMPPGGRSGAGVPMPGSMGPHGYGYAHSPFAGVQFTDEQRAKLKELMARERDAQQQRIEQMQVARTRLRELYQAELWDVKAITAAYDAIFAEQRKSIEAMAKWRNSVYEMLSDEQRAQMKQYQDEMRRSGTQPQQ